MGRPLSGAKCRSAAGWKVSLPARRGSHQRQSYVFREEADADRWVATGIEALNTGDSLPVPPSAQLSQGSARTASGPRAGTSFRKMGEAWMHERYQYLHRAGVDREVNVGAHLAMMSDWIEGHNLVLETLTREHVKELFKLIAEGTETSPAPLVPPGLDPQALVTMDEALLLPGTPSKSTLKRRRRDGTLTAVVRADGRVCFRIGDLYTAGVGAGVSGGLRRGPRARDGYCQRVIEDYRWVLEAVFKHARDNRVSVPDDRESLALPRSQRARTRHQPVPWRTCVAIAEKLHVVHQVALWLARVQGLRISEAYGLRVSDLQDNGLGHPGILWVRSQGGRKFVERDPKTKRIIARDRVDRLKNFQSYRVLVVPPALMDLLRVVVTVFHTDSDGSVREDARLIPGVKKRDSGGQQAFRTALSRAAVAVALSDGGFDVAKTDCTPHNLRRSILSDLDRMGLPVSHCKRFAGHAGGTDVHYRSYVLDDPELRPQLDIANAIQAEITAEVGTTLMVPTLVRCTKGTHKALVRDAARIETELAGRGWLLIPDNEGQPLLSAAEVAQELGISVGAARRWMANGTIPSLPWVDCPRGQERRARLDDVLAAQQELSHRLTLTELAEELGQGYRALYGYVQSEGLALESDGHKGQIVPPDTAARIRAHVVEQAELHRRAVPLSEAGRVLRCTPAAVLGFVRSGQLVEDTRAHDGRRMITRASLEWMQRKQTRPHATGKPAKSIDGVLSWKEAKTLTGLDDIELNALVSSGILIRRDKSRRRHLTRRSVLDYLIEHDPDRLLRQAG